MYKYWIYDSDSKTKLNHALSLSIIYKSIKWFILSFKKVPFNKKYKKNNIESKLFFDRGFILKSINLKLFSREFLSHVELGIKDLKKRKKIEEKNSGNYRTFESTIYSFDKNGLKEFNDCEFGKKILETVNNISDDSFKCKNIQLHLNYPNETTQVFTNSNIDLKNNKHIGFHTDNNINTIKAMVYLDIKNGDGAFEYVPNSQNWTSLLSFSVKKAIRNSGLMPSNIETLNKLNSVWKFIRLRSEMTAMKASNPIIKSILIKKERLGESPGDVVIFNPIGIHRGGQVFKSKRIALQIIFSPEEKIWAI